MNYYVRQVKKIEGIRRYKKRTNSWSKGGTIKKLVRDYKVSKEVSKMAEDIVLDFSTIESESDIELRDPIEWREAIKKAAIENLGLSEDEAQEFIDKEAPISTLSEELEMEEE